MCWRATSSSIGPVVDRAGVVAGRRLAAAAQHRLGDHVGDHAGADPVARGQAVDVAGSGARPRPARPARSRRARDSVSGGKAAVTKPGSSGSRRLGRGADDHRAGVVAQRLLDQVLALGVGRIGQLEAAHHRHRAAHGVGAEQLLAQRQRHQLAGPRQALAVDRRDGAADPGGHRRDRRLWRPAPRRPRSTRRSGSSTVRGAARRQHQVALERGGQEELGQRAVPARIVDASDRRLGRGRPRTRSISTGIDGDAPNSDAPRSPAPIRTMPNRTSGASSASSRATGRAAARDRRRRSPSRSGSGRRSGGSRRCRGCRTAARSRRAPSAPARPSGSGRRPTTGRTRGTARRTAGGCRAPATPGPARGARGDVEQPLGRLVEQVGGEAPDAAEDGVDLALERVGVLGGHAQPAAVPGVGDGLGGARRDQVEQLVEVLARSGGTAARCRGCRRAAARATRPGRSAPGRARRSAAAAADRRVAAAARRRRRRRGRAPRRWRSRGPPAPRSAAPAARRRGPARRRRRRRDRRPRPRRRGDRPAPRPARAARRAGAAGAALNRSVNGTCRTGGSPPGAGVLAITTYWPSASTSKSATASARRPRPGPGRSAGRRPPARRLVVRITPTPRLSAIAQRSADGTWMRWISAPLARHTQNTSLPSPRCRHTMAWPENSDVACSTSPPSLASTGTARPCRARRPARRRRRPR
jgi:hypothetical protein